MSLFQSLASRRSNRFLAACAILACAAAPASAQTPVVFGDVITQPGVYFLAGNQTGTTSDGIRIQSDDVTLLLLRFTLRGDFNYEGIVSQDNDRVVIYGGRVTHFRNGITLTDGDDCAVKDVRLDHSGFSGLLAFRMTDSAFLRLRCDCNGAQGIWVSGGENNRLISILAHDNERNGILITENTMFADSSLGVPLGHKVRQCWAAYNDLDGIRVEFADHVEIVSNQCVNNSRAGIHLFGIGPVAGPGTDGPTVGTADNLVKSNWCVFNEDGIVVDRGAQGNTLTNNTALANFGHDMIDDNDSPPCANTWFLNFFLTKDGDGEDCIF